MFRKTLEVHMSASENFRALVTTHLGLPEVDMLNAFGCGEVRMVTESVRAQSQLLLKLVGTENGFNFVGWTSFSL